MRRWESPYLPLLPYFMELKERNSKVVKLGIESIVEAL
jgi:hypothetical protein